MRSILLSRVLPFLILLASVQGFAADCPELFSKLVVPGAVKPVEYTVAGDIHRVIKPSDLTRETNIKAMQQGEFDVLVIGGGSAGLGSAVDAANRGLKVALVEAGDFASETSSKSTKLLHGGVRYLEQLVMTLLKQGKFDKVLYNLIRDALKERKVVKKIAPHNANSLAIVTPVYSHFEMAKFYTGLKAYDFLAGPKSSLGSTYLVGPGEVLKQFPNIKKDGLKGGVVYFDGQFNDARLALNLAQTAQERGAKLANYVGAESLIKENGQVKGATVKDQLSGQTFQVRAKAVINATGPFADQIRKMDDPAAMPMVAGASGTHLMLSKKFLPGEEGFLIPKTRDGRVLFILPWQGHALVGTTDNKAAVIKSPKPTEEDIQYILEEFAKYFDNPPTREDVLSAWTGIRPLVTDPSKHDTAQLARDHVVQISPSGLMTLTGGKWTTYRKMALDVVDQTVKHSGLKPPFPMRTTENLVLVGGRGYSKALPEQLKREFSIETDIAENLSRNYGDEARDVLRIAKQGYGNRLVPGHPFIEAEVVHSYLAESARKPADILSRRTRLSFLDKESSLKALPRVVEILGKLEGWTPERSQAELKEALEMIQ